MQLSELLLNRYLYRQSQQDLSTNDAGEVSSNIDPAPSNAVASGNTVLDINTNSMTINGGQLSPGSLPQAAFNIANLGWTQTSVLTLNGVNPTNKVDWAAGDFTSSDGTVYHIVAGDTGTMTSRTYIYLDTNVSTTAYQVTTNQADVIGPGRVLVAVAENGTAAAAFNTVETALITANNILVNSLSAISANMGSITAGTISVIAGGNTVSFTPSSAVVMIAGPTGVPTFSLTASGLLTTIGMSSLNIKTSTDFENVAGARFTKAVGGTGAADTSTYGLDITTGATGTSFAEVTWFQNFNVFANSPVFTAVARIINTDTMGNNGRCFIGLGSIGTAGNGNTFAGKTFCGFQFEKTGGVINLTVRQNDGNGAGGTTSATLSSALSDLDSIDLIMKIHGTASIDYYYRINTAAISAITTLSTHVPTLGETGAYFSITNITTAKVFDMAVVSASYER